MIGRLRRSVPRLPFLAVAAALVVVSAGVSAQNVKSFDVSARKYTFRVSGSDKAEIRVPVGALVRIVFSAEDIAHSFTTLAPDTHYRINRRAEPGAKPTVFDFRADKAGTFPFGCILATDERCSKEMKGVLIVE
jgi:heme/copper-type cytochrome/quinol oxidase subunit 2